MKHLRETLQELAALPNDRPMGMPGAFYTSQEYYEHETRTVLRSGWHCLGREDEIPNTGDYFTAQLLNEPLLVVRGDDGNVRILANVCRHRGMPLAEGLGDGAKGLNEAERKRSTLFAKFPTQVASQAASLLVSLSLFPINADLVRVKWTMSVYQDNLDDDTIAQRIALWSEVNREDREKLEKMQVALGSAHATSGPLAGDDYEGTIRDFQVWLAKRDAALTSA